MSDELQPVVQRMIDAGESEENIATVIQHYKSRAITPVAADEPDTFAGGVMKSLKAQGKELARGTINTLPFVGGAVGGMIGGGLSAGLGALPATALGAGVGQGARDIIGHVTGLDAPSTPMEKAGSIGKEVAITGATGIAAAAGHGLYEAAKTPLRTAGELSEQFGRMMPNSVRRLGNMFPSLPKSAPAPIMQRPAWQTWPQESPVDLTTPVKAGSLTQEEIARRVAAVQANGGLPAQAEAMPKVRGVIRTAPAAPQPEPEAMPESWKPFANVKPQPQDALRQPRVEIGAERVGRSAGMTKEAVRQQTGPIVGEELGEASPILPSDPLKRIVDTMKAMPPNEREAYVAQATAGKSRGQVENIRRTLEHLGLLVAAPVAGGMALRDALMQRMNGGASSSTSGGQMQ